MNDRSNEKMFISHVSIYKSACRGGISTVSVKLIKGGNFDTDAGIIAEVLRFISSERANDKHTCYHCPSLHIRMQSDNIISVPLKTESCCASVELDKNISFNFKIRLPEMEHFCSLTKKKIIAINHLEKSIKACCASEHIEGGGRNLAREAKAMLQATKNTKKKLKNLNGTMNVKKLNKSC